MRFRLTRGMICAVTVGWGCMAMGSPLPTADQLQQMIDSGQYSQALPQIERVVALKGDAASQYDRFHILMLDVECRLQLHQKEALASKTKDAVDEAIAEHNLDDLGEISALQLLVRAAKGDTYTPSTGDDRPKFNILDRSARDQTNSYLYADTLSEIKQENLEAKGNASLAPMLDLATRFTGVRSLEHRVKKSTTETDELGKKYTNWCSHLISAYLTHAQSDLDHMKQRANQMIEVMVAGKNGLHKVRRKRGLSSDDLDKIQTIRTTCHQIPPAIAELTLAFNHPLMIADKVPDAGDVEMSADDLVNNFRDGGDGSGGDDGRDTTTVGGGTRGGRGRHGR